MAQTNSVKAFLAATFVAAGALGSIAPFVTIPALSALAVPASVIAKTGAAVEIGGSLFAGLVAALLSHQRRIIVE